MRLANLKRFFDVLERKGGRTINILLRNSRESLETSPREPFWNVFDCGREHLRFGQRILTGTYGWGEHPRGSFQVPGAISTAFIASSDAA
jgi:hypothetical protein